MEQPYKKHKRPPDGGGTGETSVKYILIASLFAAAGRYSDMPIWELVACFVMMHIAVLIFKKV